MNGSGPPDTLSCFRLVCEVAHLASPPFHMGHLTDPAGQVAPANVERVSWTQSPTAEREPSTAGTAGRVILSFVAVLYVVEAFDTLTGGWLEQEGGIEPRDLEGIDGIVLAPLIHGDWAHLLANTAPLLLLGFFLLLSGLRRWAAVTATVWLVGGVGVWLFGPAGTIHVGASVLVFGWLVYLMLRGLVTGHPGQLALGVILLLLYGGALWGVLPGQPGVSWQGHLFGAVGGALAVWQLDRKGGRPRSR